jgi:hypothetical protein
MLLVLASAVFLGSESLGTWEHILLSHIWDFPFRRLLRLAGSRWRYSTPPPHGYDSVLLNWTLLYNHFARTEEKTPFPTTPIVVFADLLLSNGTQLTQTIFLVLFITTWHGSHRKHSSSIVTCTRLRGNTFAQLFHTNGCRRHISYRDTSSIVACGHYLATAVSLPPQFLLWANTPQYIYHQIEGWLWSSIYHHLSSLLVVKECKLTIRVWIVIESFLIAVAPSNMQFFFILGPSTRNISPTPRLILRLLQIGFCWQVLKLNKYCQFSHTPSCSIPLIKGFQRIMCWTLGKTFYFLQTISKLS